jgi:hypothetical protein
MDLAEYYARGKRGKVKRLLHQRDINVEGFGANTVQSSMDDVELRSLETRTIEEVVL